MKNIFENFNKKVETEVITEAKAADTKAIEQSITDFLMGIYDAEKDNKKAVKLVQAAAAKIKASIDADIKDL